MAVILGPCYSVGSNYSAGDPKIKRLAQNSARRKSLKSWRRRVRGLKAKGRGKASGATVYSTEYQKHVKPTDLFIPPGPRLGDKVLEIQQPA